MLEIMTAAPAPALMMMVAKAGQGEGPTTAPELRGGEEGKDGRPHFDADSGFGAHH